MQGGVAGGGGVQTAVYQHQLHISLPVVQGQRQGDGAQQGRFARPHLPCDEQVGGLFAGEIEQNGLVGRCPAQHGRERGHFGQRRQHIEQGHGRLFTRKVDLQAAVLFFYLHGRFSKYFLQILGEGFYLRQSRIQHIKKCATAAPFVVQFACHHTAVQLVFG